MKFFTPFRLNKFLALLLLLIPTIFITLFLFGEIAGGESGGLIHLFQLLPLFIIVFIVWKNPLHGGVVLLVLGLGLGPIYFTSAKHQPLTTTLLVEAVLFLPLILSGLLLLIPIFLPHLFKKRQR